MASWNFAISDCIGADSINLELGKNNRGELMNDDKYYRRSWLFIIGIVLLFMGLLVMPIKMRVSHYGFWSVASLLIMGVGVYLALKSILYNPLKRPVR